MLGWKQLMAFDECFGDTDEPARAPACMGSEELECRPLVKAVASHQDPFRLLDDDAARERLLQVSRLRKPFGGEID